MNDYLRKTIIECYAVLVLGGKRNIQDVPLEFRDEVAKIVVLKTENAL